MAYPNKSAPARYDDFKEEKKRVADRLQALGQTRPAKTVNADLAALRLYPANAPIRLQDRPGALRRETLMQTGQNLEDHRGIHGAAQGLCERCFTMTRDGLCLFNTMRLSKASEVRSKALLRDFSCGSSAAIHE
jgi:hypothetical protein